MTAPQVIAIILLTVKVVFGACFHGRQSKISFGYKLGNAAIWATVLYCGGFFD